MTKTGKITLTILAAAVLGTGLAAPAPFTATKAYADPPYWAPAHGYHKHHKYHHRHYNGDDYYYSYPEYEEEVVVVEPLPLFPSYQHVEVRCQSQPIIGAVLGGVAGGLIGNQFGKGNGRDAATIGGALLGAALGADVARQDADCMAQAFEYAKPGTQVAWSDPDNGDAYSVLPTRDFRRDGRYCREYQAHIRVDGELKNSYGTACRQPDGEWEIVN